MEEDKKYNASREVNILDNQIADLAFTNQKEKKLEEEIIRLKAKLYDFMVKEET